MRGLPISDFRFPIAGTALAALLLLGGCGADTGKSAPNATQAGVVRTATDGPVTLTLSVTPAELSYTERATVVVEVLSDASVTLEFVEYDRDKTHLEHQYEYRLARGERRAAVPTPDGKLTWRYQYDVQFFAPGEFEFPATSVRLTTVGATTGESRELKTEGIAVRARDPNAKSLTPEELRKLTTLSPVELRQGWGTLAWVGAALVAAAVISLWLLRRRGERAVIEIPVLPQEWARREFALLKSDRLVERGLIQEFYYRVSGIVRGYIERRFSVSAPEMTTEEFLVAAAKDRRFGPRHGAELQHFLTACDLVKYAKQIPSVTEADQVLAAAGEFVERTTLEATPEASAA